MGFAWEFGFGVGFKHQTPNGAIESRRCIEQINTEVDRMVDRRIGVKFG